VSSITSKSFPLYFSAYKAFRMKVLALPIWSAPDGNGARRKTILFLTFGSSASPPLWASFSLTKFDRGLKCFSCSFFERALTFFTISCIVGMTF